MDAQIPSPAYVHSETEKKAIENYLSLRNEKLKFISRLRVSIEPPKDKGGKSTKRIPIKRSAITPVNPLVNSVSLNQDEKLIVVSKYRIMIFKIGGFKPERDFHIFELEEVQIPSSSKASFRFQQAILHTLMKSVESLVDAVRICWISNFPNYPEENTPPIRMHNGSLSTLRVPISSCGGFVRTYRSLSNLWNVPVCEDVCWDVDNLFELNNIRDFNFSEFQTPLNDQVRLITEALRYNNWFESLRIESTPTFKVDIDLVVSMSDILKDNHQITIFSCRGISNGNSYAAIGKNLKMAPTLHTVDFSLSALEDRGVIALCREWFGTFDNQIFISTKQTPTISCLNLSQCKIEKLGMYKLLRSLMTVKTLQELKISHNKLRKEGTLALMDLLQQSKELNYLDIANSEVDFKLLSAIQETKSKLNFLNLSENNLSKKVVCQQLNKFLQGIPTLTSLNISSTKISTHGLQIVLQNLKILKVLNISDNSLSDQGIIAFSDFLLGKASKNGKEVEKIENAPLPMPLLQTLYMNSIFESRTKERAAAVESLIRIVDSSAENSNATSNGGLRLRVFHCAGDITNPRRQLREDILPLVFHLMLNETLQELKISGHSVGEALAITLSKVIQCNKNLQVLEWDDNRTTYQGFKKFQIALERNSSLIRMPLPYKDIAAIGKDPLIAKRLNSVIDAIQDCILQNNAQSYSENDRNEQISSPQELKSSFMSLLPAPPFLAEIMYDYVPTDTRMLSLWSGRQLTVLDLISEDWWFAEFEGREGLVPSNHLRLIAAVESSSAQSSPNSSSPALQISTRIRSREFSSYGSSPFDSMVFASLPPLPTISKGSPPVKAPTKSSLDIRGHYKQLCKGLILHDYEPNDSRMLTLEKGKLIKILDRKTNSNWWKAYFKGKYGLVPSNFISILDSSSSLDLRRSSSLSSMSSSSSPKSPNVVEISNDVDNRLHIIDNSSNGNIVIDTSTINNVSRSLDNSDVNRTIRVDSSICAPLSEQEVPMRKTSNSAIQVKKTKRIDAQRASRVYSLLINHQLEQQQEEQQQQE